VHLCVYCNVDIVDNAGYNIIVLGNIEIMYRAPTSMLQKD